MQVKSVWVEMQQVKNERVTERKKKREKNGRGGERGGRGERRRESEMKVRNRDVCSQFSPRLDWMAEKRQVQEVQAQSGREREKKY